MKKLILLVMSAILIAFTGCNQNEPQPDPIPNVDRDTTVVDNNTKTDDNVDLGKKIDPEQSTTVTIVRSTNVGVEHLVVDDVSVYNEKGILVGFGGYAGDYLVPYNGYIQITYHGEYDVNFSEQKTDRFAVGTMKRLRICLCMKVYYSPGEFVIYSFVADGN